MVPSFQVNLPGTVPLIAPPFNWMLLSDCPSVPDAVGFVLMVGVAFLISTSMDAAGMPVKFTLSSTLYQTVYFPALVPVGIFSEYPLFWFRLYSIVPMPLTVVPLVTRGCALPSYVRLEAAG